MKKIILSLLVFVAMAAHADPYDVTVRQRNAADTGYLDRFIPFPAGGESCLFALDGPSILPKCYLIGTGLSLSSGVLSVAAGGGQLQADWTQANTSAADFIKNRPATFTPSAHTHDAADVNSGTLADARIPALAISKTTGLQGALDAKAETSTVNAVLATKQNALTLTTAGTGAATLTGAALNIPTPAAAAAFNFSQPAARTLAVSTSYQATDTTKAAVIYPSYACQNATQVLASSACTIQIRMGTGTLTCSTGTVYYTQSLTVNLGVLITQNSTNPVPILLPIGASFILCPSAGTFTISAVEQTAG